MACGAPPLPSPLPAGGEREQIVASPFVLSFMEETRTFGQRKPVALAPRSGEREGERGERR